RLDAARLHDAAERAGGEDDARARQAHPEPLAGRHARRGHRAGDQDARGEGARQRVGAEASQAQPPLTRNLSVERADGIAVVRIQRPPANALAPDLLAEGAELVERLLQDLPDAVVIAGSGGFFSGGVDLKLAPTLSVEEQRGMVGGINRLFCDWYGFPRPVVAAVNGHARGGGRIPALWADRRSGAR